MRQKANKRMGGHLIIFILLICFTFWFIFKDQDLELLFKTIKSANIFYLLIGALCMFGYHFFESINLRSILIAFGEKKLSIAKALKFTLIGFFFSSITPAATGGQPIEIYYMTKEGISGAKATMTSLILLCSFQISTISLGIICACINSSLLKGGILWIYLLGLTINGTALVFLLMCVFSNKLVHRIANFAIRKINKLKLKNIKKRTDVILKSIEKYEESSVFIKQHLGEFFKAFLRCFIQICLYYSVPFFIYKSLGLSGHSFFQLFVMQAVLYTTVSGLPLPGAVGVTETIFLKIFKGAFGVNLIGASMLLSRTVTFYLYVLISLIIVIVNAVDMKDVKGEIDKTVIEIEGKTSKKFANAT